VKRRGRVGDHRIEVVDAVERDDSGQRAIFRGQQGDRPSAHSPIRPAKDASGIDVEALVPGADEPDRFAQIIELLSCVADGVSR
jgi:hypothetical protein